MFYLSKLMLTIFNYLILTAETDHYLNKYFSFLGFVLQGEEHFKICISKFRANTSLTSWECVNFHCCNKTLFFSIGSNRGLWLDHY